MLSTHKSILAVSSKQSVDVGRVLSVAAGQLHLVMIINPPVISCKNPFLPVVVLVISEPSEVIFDILLVDDIFLLPGQLPQHVELTVEKHHCQLVCVRCMLHLFWQIPQVDYKSRPVLRLVKVVGLLCRNEFFSKG